MIVMRTHRFVLENTDTQEPLVVFEDTVEQSWLFESEDQTGSRRITEHRSSVRRTWKRQQTRARARLTSLARGPGLGKSASQGCVATQGLFLSSHADQRPRMEISYKGYSGPECFTPFGRILEKSAKLTHSWLVLGIEFKNKIINLKKNRLTGF